MCLFSGGQVTWFKDASWFQITAFVRTPCSLSSRHGCANFCWFRLFIVIRTQLIPLERNVVLTPQMQTSKSSMNQVREALWLIKDVAISIKFTDLLKNLKIGLSFVGKISCLCYPPKYNNMPLWKYDRVLWCRSVKKKQEKSLMSLIGLICLTF